MDEQQNHGPLEGIFHKIAKATIIIPIVIVAVAFILKDSSRGTNASNNRFRSPTNNAPNTASTPTPVAQPPPNRLDYSANVKVDLKGPLYCTYTTPQLVATGSIKNRNIFVEINKQGVKENILVNGDCMYRWQPGKTVGEKSCGLGQVLGMIDTMAQFNLITMETIVNALSGLNMSPSISPPSAEVMAKACVKQEVADAVFTIPKGISFAQGTPAPTP